MMQYHIPVLRKETVDLLQLHNDGIYVDATLGGGGHFFEMISRIQRGLLIGIDADVDAIENGRKRLEEQGFICMKEKDNSFFFAKEGIIVVLVHENYAHIAEIVRTVCESLEEEISGIDGMLFDLGVSSFQIDKPEKGFSYMHDGPLDMRMDQRLQVSAADLVNGMYEQELVQILKGYGEEIYAKRIARNIVKARKEKKIERTDQLKEVIKKSVPYTYRNPYAKTFQALRIAVNNELGELEISMAAVPSLLKSKGRIAVISFHSLEDRIVKNSFKDTDDFLLITRVQPSDNEVDMNKRARSATLRIYERK